MAVSAGSGTLKIYEGDDTPWDEQCLSWFHRPWKVRRLDALTQDFVAGQEYELDVLPAMHKSGARTFILEYEWSIEGIAFSSREGSFAPQLVVQTLRGAPVAGGEPQLAAFGSLENMEAITEDIRVYPNPLQDKLTIEMQGAEETGTVSIELYDHLGTPLYRKNWRINSSNPTITLDLGGLSLKPGFYVFKLRTADNRVTTQKLYKK
jgi:hypothetical protein